ncbi:MAG: NAD(P)H-hydrate dehydratase [Alphaproteobacteria bacterium]|nr:NAD(P)H-hydrate dehydratase [Alphaproteobacteria bacterium]
MNDLNAHILLSTSQMAAADRYTIENGTDGATLMQRAGTAVAAQVMQRFDRQPVVVLVGPGNNGGDGFVVAQALHNKGWPVRVGLLGEMDALSGDAAIMAAKYNGEVHPLHPFLLNERGLVVDALFGTGISRPISGVAAEVIEKLNRLRLPCVAVDIASGIDGDTGQIMGCAVQAQTTITFHRKKFGHVLLPGAKHCGEVVVVDIGIAPDALDKEKLNVHENTPLLWQNMLPWPHCDSHKFTRGHAVVQGGAVAYTGAARLAARAALRSGAGLVSITCSREALPVYAAALEAVMTRPIVDIEGLVDLLKDPRITAFLIGPGAGVNSDTHEKLLAALKLKKPVVMDADALSVAAQNPQPIFDILQNVPAILTPHGGEFARLFGNAAYHSSDKISLTRHAAELSNAVVVLKGSDTVVAAPDGRVSVNIETSPWLATAGTGDVLAGICCGLLAANMPAFEAASAAVWMHSAAARYFGAGLIAEDLPDILPRIWQTLEESITDGST